MQLRPGGRYSATRVREFVSRSHKIWDWRYDETGQRLLHLKKGGTMDIYIPSQIPGYGRRPNCWTRTAPWDLAIEDTGVICSVKDASLGVKSLCSHAQPAPSLQTPTTFWDVLASRGHTWMWDNMQIVGDTTWISDAIHENTGIAVADGSYIRELTTEAFATAFFFESADRSCKLVGAFPERSETANAYRGELLGLMAIHLILLAVNKVSPNLTGSIMVYSDCERAIGSIEALPSLKIPAKYKHSDILKNIMVNCSSYQSSPG